MEIWSENWRKSPSYSLNSICLLNISNIELTSRESSRMMEMNEVEINKKRKMYRNIRGQGRETREKILFSLHLGLHISAGSDSKCCTDGYELAINFQCSQLHSRLAMRKNIKIIFQFKKLQNFISIPRSVPTRVNISPISEKQSRCTEWNIHLQYT